MGRDSWPLLLPVILSVPIPVKEKPGPASLSEQGTVVDGNGIMVRMSNLNLNDKLKGKENKFLNHI